MNITVDATVYDRRTGREGRVVDTVGPLIRYELHCGVTAYSRPADLIVRDRPRGNGRLPLNAND